MAVPRSEYDRHVALDYGRMALYLATLIFSIFFAVLVIWLVASKQDSKLYLDDNVVCVSQPGALSCFERKP